MLSLFQLLGGKIDKLRLHKLLFLYSQRKKESEYEFVPYKYGCYSYSANADIITMIKKEYLSEVEKVYTKLDKKNYLELVKEQDRKLLNDIATTYGKMKTDALIKHTYRNFPFYATKSIIAEKMLATELYKKVLDAVPRQDTQQLFTIGYQGISLEKYLNKLIRNNIKLLVDVRKNPLSQKYGFSKTLLKRYCNSLGIEYIHIPEVGINSKLRRSLENQDDYDKLFEGYKETTLKETTSEQEEIVKLLVKYNRIALTCFEADICQCHRLHLAESLKNQKNDLLIRHI